MGDLIFDRFQGAWLGSIIGAALTQDSSQLNDSDYQKIVQYKLPSWVKTREDIARLIIAEEAITSIDLKNILAIPTDFQEIVLKDRFIMVHCHILFLLLSLTISGEDREDTYSEILSQDNLGSVNPIGLKQDIKVWNYLLTLAFHNQFQVKSSNIDLAMSFPSNAISKVINSAVVQTTPLKKKLEIVSQSWENGWSLRQLTKRLFQQKNQDLKEMPTASLAIALSFYCFISTPENFMLSVKRASKIDSPLSVPITILTATISGAYNGLTGIPRKNHEAANNHQAYQQTQKTLQELFKTWLGIYRYQNNSELLYDSEINVVDVPGNIQFRPSLNIISQKSNLT